MRHWQRMLALLSSCAAAPLWAAPESSLQIGPAGDYLLKSMLILLVLLVVMALLLKLLRRYGHLKKINGNRIRVIEGVSLGGNERAVLVGIGDEEILLGVSPGRIQPLLKLGSDSARTPATNFADLLPPGPGS